MSDPCDPRDCVACQAPLFMGFSRQEYWSVLPFPSPGDLPDPGIKPRSPALQADSLPTEISGKPKRSCFKISKIWIYFKIQSTEGYCCFPPVFLFSFCRSKQLSISGHLPKRVCALMNTYVHVSIFLFLHQMVR